MPSLNIVFPPIPPESSTTLLVVREDNRIYARLLEQSLRQFQSGVNALTISDFLPDGDKGDISISAAATVFSIDAGAVTNSKLRNSAARSVIGRYLGSVGPPEDIVAFTGESSILVYRDDTGVVEFLPFGTTGVLKITGTTFSSALVVTADISDDQVTYAKVQNVSAASRLMGRGSAAGAGDPQEIVLGTNLSMSGTTLNASGAGGSGDSFMEWGM